jgi:cytochrome c peroxidase
MRLVLARLATFAFAAAAASSALAQITPLPASPTIPKDNPQTKEKIELGKALFFDPRLSVDGTISCNSCHNVMAGGDDARPVSVGVHGQTGGRSSPTVWNSAYLSSFFWDGRAGSLEEQAKGPLLNAVEMGKSNHRMVTGRIAKIPGYVAQYDKVFGKDAVNIDNTAKAIAAFERTLITPNSKVDKFLGGDKKALSDEEQRGLKLVTDVGCTSCHNGPNFAGPAALPQGTPFLQKFPTFTDNVYVAKYNLKADGGRVVQTKNEADRDMWRVPTWRNIALTAPYFHNGSVKTLDEAVRVMAKVQLNKTLPDQDVRAITAFLVALTGEFPSVTVPRLPETIGSSLVNKNGRRGARECWGALGSVRQIVC